MRDSLDLKPLILFLVWIACRPESLPAGTAIYEGDRIQETFAARPGLDTKQMFDRVVAPLLRRKGLGAVVPGMSIPPRGFVYQQRVNGVAVEHAGLIATPTSVQGLVFSRYRVTNARKLSSIAATPRDRIALQSELVLFPAGNTRDRRMSLRYAYRMLLADRNERSRTWMAWIDAETGKTLQLAPQFTVE